MNPFTGWITAFEIAPKLRVVHLANFDLRDVVTFPTENSVSFYGDRPFPQEDEISEYLSVIKSAQALLSFTYHHSNHGFQPDEKKPPLVEKKPLQTLSTSLGKFLSPLVLPGFKSMSLTTGSTIPGMFPCADDALFELHVLITRSQCSLTKLYLVDVTMDEYLLPIIQLSPKLEVLGIQYLNEWSEGSGYAIKSLFLCMTETIKDHSHHTLVPSLKQMQITLYVVDT